MSYLEGEIQRYLFYSEESAYSVIKVKIVDTNDPDIVHLEPTIIVCGFFPKLETKVVYRFHGELTHHAKYGIQYTAERFERLIDNTYEGLLDYLSSDLFKGVGKKTAERIIDSLGMEALDLIAEDKHVLDKVNKIGDKLRDSIFEQVVNNRQLENTLVWLYSFDISPKMAMRIFQYYGTDTIQIIKENPYVLMNYIEGIGFKRADEIGLKVGFAYDSPLRVSAVIYYLLNEYMNKFGDTYLKKDELIDYTLKFLNNHPDFNIESSLVESQINSLANQSKIIIKEDLVAINYVYYSEEFIAKKVLRLADAESDNFSEAEINNLIETTSFSGEITYTEVQLKAIFTSLTNNFSIVTGGPGTGKTTVIRGIVQTFLTLHNYQNKDLIKLAAPTGKAAKRLSEATGFTATTVHKLLGYDFTGNFKYDDHNLIDAQLLIVDEASMLDCLLAKRLFQAIRLGTKVVLVGDANQLPSVGPGDVLNDLINSDLFNTVKLDLIHRQASDSKIISLAYDILNKNINEDFFHNYEDREFLNANDQFISSRIIERINRLIKAGYSLIEDIQVLIPVYKGFNGIDRINSLIQSSFNSQNKQFSLKYKDKEFWYNDKVMQLVNQPEDNVMNGDQGLVVGITDNDELIVDFSDNLVKYNLKDLDNLTLAYAVSIHKSQGSEFRSVILPLSKAYTIMLKRKLLYTAVTRAKEKLYLIGDFEAYKRGVLGSDRKRKTQLNTFLEEEINHNSQKQVKISDFM